MRQSLLPHSEAFSDFDAQLQTIEPHRRPGFLHSFYAETMGQIISDLTIPIYDFTDRRERGDVYDFGDTLNAPLSTSWNPAPYVVACESLANLLDKWDVKDRFKGQIESAYGLPTRVELASGFRANLFEFTTDELLALRDDNVTELGGKPELLARYGRSIKVGDITPHQFFKQGTAYSTIEDPAAAKVGENAQGDFDPDSVLFYPRHNQHPAWELSYLHMDGGVDNDNTIRQTYDIPGYGTYASHVYTPVKNDKLQDTIIWLTPENDPTVRIDVDQDATEIPELPGIVFEEWEQRALMGPVVDWFYGIQDPRQTPRHGTIQTVNFIRGAN